MAPKKGKGKALPESFDDFMDAALYQENQATRYQFGEKAQRHYEESAKLYQEAYSLAEESAQKHDASYNLGRIQYALATEIYGLPECYRSVLWSIKLYRQCLTIQSYSIDAAYNLAQSLHTLGEWISDGAPSTSSIASLSSLDAWKEARTLLQQVEQAQTAMLERSSGSNTPTSSQSSQSGASTPVNEGDAAMVDTAAIEETVITPSTIIETILTAIDVDISLLGLFSEAIARDIEQKLHRASALDEKDRYMEKEIVKAQQGALRAVLEQRSDAGQTVDLSLLEQIAQEQQTDIESERRPDPAKYSDLADTLVLFADLAVKQGRTDVHPPLEQALQLYQKARDTLNNPLGRPASTPAHHIPALLSSNLCSSAEALLLIAALLSDPTSYLLQAKVAALQALDVINSPFKQAASSTPSLPKFTRTAKSVLRTDYRSITATQEAVLCITRAQLYGQTLGSEGNLSEESRKSLVALLKGTWTDMRDLEAAMESYVDECRTSAAWRLSNRDSTMSEETAWKAFAQQLLSTS